MQPRDVTEFIIIPPAARRAEILADRERLIHHLGREFRGYSFRVAPLGPTDDDDDFSVIPILNFLGDDGQSYMCQPPQNWLLAEILHSCRAFNPKAPRDRAA